MELPLALRDMNGVANKFGSRSYMITVRTFDLVVNVTKLLPPDMDDWPANIFDGVFLALERCEAANNVKLRIVEARPGMDDGQPYIHIIAQTNPVLLA